MEISRSERAFLLLSGLAMAAAEAHTEATLGARLAEVLGEHLPLVRIVVERSGGAARVFAGRAPAARPGKRGERLAVRLQEGERLVGICLVELGQDASGLAERLKWGEPLKEALARALQGAFAQVWALKRVAAVSRRAHAEQARLRGELAAALPSGVVAVAPSTRRLFLEEIPLVAAQEVPVLIRGETGTGKELVARRLHELSPRARRPFLKINCGALPESLAESLLFGHERGAFTGAIRRHAGVFERASGGTLFLDEIGELSPAMQVRLLRVLQEGEFERVGGDSIQRADVRLLAATHRPLEQMAAEGQFREDLYYRLNVVPLVVPPLRERSEDIEALVEAAMLRLCVRMKRAVPSIPAGEMARLKAWSWPGNIRELENLVERALVLVPRGKLVFPEHFAPLKQGATETSKPARSLEDTTRQVIQEALEACGGRIYGPQGAATRLGLRPTTLQSKMKKLQIARAHERN